MKCPICAEETAGQETQQWGPEWAHKRCVKAYSLGGCDARAAVQANVPDGWRPIETAPENMADPVVVFWIDREGEKHHDFDYTEDGCWMQWHNHAEHVEIIGGHGVSYTPPYTHWMPLPAAPGASAPPVAQPAPAVSVWSGLAERERDQIVDELCDLGTGFVTPLYAIIDGIECKLMERNSAAPKPEQAQPAERKPLTEEDFRQIAREELERFELVDKRDPR